MTATCGSHVPQMKGLAALKPAPIFFLLEMALIARLAKSFSRKAKDPLDVMVPALTVDYSHLALSFISIGQRV